MKLFREALDGPQEPGDMLYFRPAQRYVPRAWVEKMAGYEWACEETGACPGCRLKGGCYDGADVNGCWICKALLEEGGVLRVPFPEILKNISA
jgi:hypothetical protein